MVKTYTITEPYIKLDCGLGEGPYWEKSHNSLRFVDIVKKKIYFLDIAKGPESLKQYDLEHSIGTTADIEGRDDEFIFGGKHGYGIMKRATGEVRWIKEHWGEEERKDDAGGKPGFGKNKEERMRSNDGAVDSKGRFWVGTMNDPAVVGGGNFHDEGILFRLDNDLTLHRIQEGVTIPNGTSWTKDDTTMYFTDSPSKVIKACPYDPETGSLDVKAGTTFFTCPVEGGVPDGHAQDVEGYLWVACHGTGKVYRISPEGEVVAIIEVPTRCVTCPAFVGTELFITSAEDEDLANHPESEKYMGSLFKIDVGVEGKPQNRFKLTVDV
ncbi:hypothetical protein K431DRAFT_255643 [Polychaeton citri CBS 116435]|uniref:SMP-30/Gluconolactonase/LRE-like region domain-containing protein n=1 Tax=Polychaeton citri CBS 116435 TaxID=1314669 RepID=A0A9P4UL05_9PEZI|nr:hypothetical protein K431DRAFT_255643 [Polychaeton citri CBS 116435]